MTTPNGDLIAALDRLMPQIEQTVRRQAEEIEAREQQHVAELQTIGDLREQVEQLSGELAEARATTASPAMSASMFAAVENIAERACRQWVTAHEDREHDSDDMDARITRVADNLIRKRLDQHGAYYHGEG